MTTKQQQHTQQQVAQFISPPEAADIERALLGALITDGAAIHDALAEHLDAEHFFIVRHGWIYDAMLSLYGEGLAIDYETVLERLRERDQLEEAGGAAYLTELALAVSFTSPVRAYAAMVRRKAELRGLLQFCSGLATRIVNNQDHAPYELWQEGNEELSRLRPYTDSDEVLLGSDSILYADRAMEHDRLNPVWYSLPWKSFDDYAPVYKPGDIIIIAGPEGSGKSAMAFNLAQFYAETMHKRVLYVFTEMDLENVLARRKAANSKVQYRRLLTPEQLSEQELVEYHRADEKIGEWAPRMDYWECGATSAKTLVAGLRSHIEHFGADVIIIDGFNDLVFDVPRGETLPNTIHNFMAYMETFAREHNILLAGTVQLNREGQALGSGAYKRKSSLMLRIDVPKAEMDETFILDGVTYRAHFGQSSMFRPVHIDKNRRGVSGVFRKLAFIGPRFLWLDGDQQDAHDSTLPAPDFGGGFGA